MLIEYDKITLELQLKLPDELIQYEAEVNNELAQEFAFEPVNKNTLKQMDLFIRNWFDSKGIKLPEEKTEKKNEN